MGATVLTDILTAAKGSFHRVVPFQPEVQHILAMDFTAANTELTDEVLKNTALFTSYVNGKLKAAGAVYGIGGYAEHRTIYKRSEVFDGGTTEEEPRRLHLGIDIWGKPHTPVMSPLEGIVHSFAFNQAYGDYGATIILAHRLSGVTFFTLYGHLSLNSIKNLQEGNRVRTGDVIAEFGLPFENGQWPPHLHFQVIADLQGCKGDYPGVCRWSEKGNWLRNCPDPDLILDLNRFATASLSRNS